MDTLSRSPVQRYDPSIPSSRADTYSNKIATMSSGSMGGSIGNLQDLSENQGSNLGDGLSKKGRFVSDGQVQMPSMNYASGHMSMPYASMPPEQQYATLPNMASQQSAQPHSPHSTQQVASAYPGQTSGTSRSFSGSFMSPPGAVMGGIPTSPYSNAQYAPMPSSSSSSQQQSPYNQPSGPHSAPFLGAQSSMGASLFSPQFQNLGMQPNSGMGSFMPNINLLSMPHQGNTVGRTVYVGNLPTEASVDELLNQIKFGPIENVRILPEKNCAFISFLDGAMAAAFHADASVKKLSLHNQELKIGWGKPSVCPTPILMAVQQNQATRNVYLGQLEEHVTEQSLRDDLARFGPIDQVKIVRDKNIGFVHFLSIGTAMKVVSMLPTETAWAGKRVNYGKDRCAYVPKSQQQNQAHNNQAAAMGMAAAASLGYPTAFSPASASFSAFGGGAGPASAPPGSVFGVSGQIDDPSQLSGPQSAAANVYGAMGGPAAMQQMGNRTVYLGNIHPDTTTEEICNHIRGGILQNIRFITDKHIAFITFVDSNAALAFFHMANYSGIMIHQRRLKIGWGKHSGPLSPAIAMAVQAGGSRNVYIGNIEDFDFHTVDKLRRDFGEYGETELVNTLKEKNCAFVNFCNIQNAIKAIEAMKNHADYKNQRVGAGKDRCGNPPRALTNTLNRTSSGSHSPGAATAYAATGGLSGEDSGEVGEASLGAIVAQQEESLEEATS